jgi:hypothetical protein
MVARPPPGAVTSACLRGRDATGRAVACRLSRGGVFKLASPARFCKHHDSDPKTAGPRGLSAPADTAAAAPPPGPTTPPGPPMAARTRQSMDSECGGRKPGPTLARRRHGHGASALSGGDPGPGPAGRPAASSCTRVGLQTSRTAGASTECAALCAPCAAGHSGH